MEDFPDGLARVLCGSEALGLAGGQAERPAVMGERHNRTQLPALPARSIAPADGDPTRPRTPHIPDKPCSSERQAAAAVPGGLRVGQVELCIGSESRREDDVE